MTLTRMLKVKTKFGEVVFYAEEGLASQLKANRGAMNKLLALNFKKAIIDTVKQAKYLSEDCSPDTLLELSPEERDLVQTALRLRKEKRKRGRPKAEISGEDIIKWRDAIRSFRNPDELNKTQLALKVWGTLIGIGKEKPDEKYDGDNLIHTLDAYLEARGTTYNELIARKEIDTLFGSEEEVDVMFGFQIFARDAECIEKVSEEEMDVMSESETLA